MPLAILTGYVDAAVAHVRDRLGWYLAALVWCLLGIGFGWYAAGQLTALQRADLLSYLGGFLGNLRGGLPSGPSMMRAALWQNGRIIVLVWLLSLSVVGALSAWLALGVKGFAVGFSSAFVMGELGGRGAVLVLLGVLPPAILLLPALMLLCDASGAWAREVYRVRFQGSQMTAAFWRFGGALLICVAAVALAAILEAYLSPLALNVLWPYVGG